VATPRSTRVTPARTSTRPFGHLCRALGAAGLATTVAFLPAGAATADPQPTAAEVERRIDSLDTQVGLAVEDFRQAQLELQEAEQRLADVAARAEREQARLDEARRNVSGVVAAAYRRGGGQQLMSLIGTQDPQTYLQRAASLDRVAKGQADVVEAAQAARRDLEEAQAAAAQELEAKKAVERELAERRASIEKQLRDQQSLLEGLREQERQRVEAAREAAARQAAVPRASRDRVSAAAVTPTDVAPVYSGPASGRAAIAVQEAYNQLGKPYQWGADGPDSFDCSGLTSFVWAKAGVSLPHSSRAQYASGRKVSRDQIQPGDLVYFGSPIHHVGIYVGNGNMISATRTGQPVKMQPAFRSDFVGATRP
jgi:cell wall-associated NlpC family hydrolase